MSEAPKVAISAQEIESILPHRFPFLLVDRVLELSPGPLGTAETNFRMAEIYVSLGKREQALEHLVAASSQRPSGSWGKRSEDYLKRLR